ncbi:hypothetical protein [Sphingopyxis macrogoltabida]|uniref:HK97 gp10 family phage protein n=1 Tax=Sphingopyxis macrogoltabida TaxID=33050 RepID=A0AAC8Z164_SPHMC|nr:hypothetical protein [Sphingopyxis macrogoltabida]ALJ12638.1 hypothetical protein LH19_07140 [Sphingopyxis macrogoltabida]AMU89894.1 hypothetical protein ATM17_12695 [Sphingopyxis macrogoltabida]
MATGWTGINPAAWAENAEKRMTALLKNSVQKLGEAAAAEVPVRSGNLARSVVIDDKPPKRGEPDQKFTAQDFVLGVSKLVPGGEAYVGWQAIYSARVNYGFKGEDSLGRTYNQSANGFAERVAAKWPAILKAEAARLGGK